MFEPLCLFGPILLFAAILLFGPILLFAANLLFGPILLFGCLMLFGCFVIVWLWLHRHIVSILVVLWLHCGLVVGVFGVLRNCLLQFIDLYFKLNFFSCLIVLKLRSYLINLIIKLLLSFHKLFVGFIMLFQGFFLFINDLVFLFDVIFETFDLPLLVIELQREVMLHVLTLSI